MGDEMVGVVHPCRFYAQWPCAARVAVRPSRKSFGGIDRETPHWLANRPRQRRRAVAMIERILRTDRGDLAAMGQRARDAVATTVGKAVGCRQLCDIIQSTLPRLPAANCPVAGCARPGGGTSGLVAALRRSRVDPWRRSVSDTSAAPCALRYRMRLAARPGLALLRTTVPPETIRSVAAAARPVMGI